MMVCLKQQATHFVIQIGRHKIQGMKLMHTLTIPIIVYTLVLAQLKNMIRTGRREGTEREEERTAERRGGGRERREKRERGEKQREGERRDGEEESG